MAKSRFSIRGEKFTLILKKTNQKKHTLQLLWRKEKKG